MTGEDLIETEIERTKKNIKKLTKVTVNTCDPLKEREEQLVGFCSEITREIDKSKISIEI